MPLTSRPQFEVSVGKPGDPYGGRIIVVAAARDMIEIDARCGSSGSFLLTTTEAIDLRDAIDGALLGIGAPASAASAETAAAQACGSAAPAAGFRRLLGRGGRLSIASLFALSRSLNSDKRSACRRNKNVNPTVR